MYKHGIYVDQNPTILPISNTAKAGITAVIGTAPVNLLADPSSAVMKPIVLSSIIDVKALIGYSADANSYTLMQAVHSFFEVFGVAPIVVVNVLDPATHVTANESTNASLVNGILNISDLGILLSTLVVKSSDGTTTYTEGTDYTASFNTDGSVRITRVTTGTIPAATTEIKTTYSVIDASKVTDEEIIAGIELVNRVFPVTNINPETLIAPGYSQKSDVATALIAAAKNVSSVFKGTALCDIDSSTSKTIADAITAKASLADRDVIPSYPKVITSRGKTIFMSAHLAALMQLNDVNNDNTPFVSPSNKLSNILGTVLDDGTQVNYTIDEANQLNAEGIATALNFQGWKAWGNHTGAYSSANAPTIDVKDSFINIKRAFDWQGNGFIKRYFEAVDSPMNFRAIQTLITDENMFYNAFITAGYVAGMSIEYDQDDNPVGNLLNGAITFTQYLSPYTPIEVINNSLQFDPTMLQNALGGNE